MLSGLLEKIHTNYKQNIQKLQLVRETWSAIFSYQSEKQKFLENTIVTIELSSLVAFINGNERNLNLIKDKCVHLQMQQQVELIGLISLDLENIKKKDTIYTIFLSPYIISRRDRLENLLKICNIEISINEINLNNVLTF